MRRHRIREALGSEREALLSRLTEHMAELEAAFDEQDLSPGMYASSGGGNVVDNLPSGRNLSPRVRGVVYCRQLFARVSATGDAAAALLSDLSGYRAFEEISGELIRKTRRREASLFEEWQ
ncbi:unnamed protein product, partial [Sphacelaria rigidula]